MKRFELFSTIQPKSFETTWTSPSNIAFVKYWGKKGHQLPANPSLSMTLKKCVTKTHLSIMPAERMSVQLLLEGSREVDFESKITKYLEGLDFPWLNNIHFKITTHNTFPHGTGIASSASGLSAFVLGLTEYMYQSIDLQRDQEFFQRASILSRLASGSACRSLYGGFVSWGEISDEYATAFNVHANFAQLRDTIVVVSAEEKKISSRQGHDRMNLHPFAQARFTQAKSHYHLMKDALVSGDFDTVGKVLESEALSLHAMMMTSPESYTLLKPNSLRVMDKIRNFRQETKIPLYFTLDAGPNLHLIHPKSDIVDGWIQSELGSLSENIIYDELGEGPFQC